jgi:predicted ATPase/DNA-binding CsgD family transcriptional regulator
VGKTRLALRTAAELARGLPDGTWFVDLLALADPGLLAQEVASALGLSDASTRWAVDGLGQHIGDREMLLVLDNCEHLLDACAVLTDSLVRTCPNLRVLATSRRSLGIRAEEVVRVAPMDVPEEGSVTGDAVDLLIRRAQAVAPGFTPGRDELRAAAALCRRLDGIPLAIELAAGRLRTLTIEQVLARLGNRFEILAGRDATAPLHHRTLHATLDWSWDLAAEDERVLWRRLSVFSTDFELDAVESICGGEALHVSRVLEALDGLVDQSIVVATTAGPTMRYQLLESVRDYGAEALRAHGEVDVVRARLFAHYAGLCRQAWEHWTTADQPRWFDRLAAEHANLRSALDWAMEHDTQAGGAMAADMWLYWEARDHLTEGRRRLARSLEVLRDDSVVRPRALWVAGYLALAQADPEPGRALLESALEAAAEGTDDESIAYATQYLGLAQLFAGDLSAAERMLEQAYRMHDTVGSRTAAFALTDLAVTVMLAGDLPRSIGLYDRALVAAGDGGDPWTRSHLLWGLGVARFLDGDAPGAEQAEKDALELIGELDERSGIALCLEALAWTAAARGAFERAAALRGASSAVWESIPRELPEPLQVHARGCERRIVERLGSGRRKRLYDEGRRLGRTAAVALGLERPVAEAVTDRERSVLSRREMEVATLVAEGLTDREIAARLVISQRTAESHVQHALTKLGFRSRAQIATWVTRRPSR